MSEYLPSPEIEDRIRLALTRGLLRPEFVRRLEHDLRQRARARKVQPARRERGPAWRWALAIALALVLATLAIGPTKLAQAMQRLLGYVPGIGLVDETTGLRVLESPVSIQEDGVTVTIEEGVADSQRTVILMRVDGIPPEARPAGEDGPSCAESPRLIIPGETDATLEMGGGQGWGSGYASRLVYGPIPAWIDIVRLRIPCLFDTAPGLAPEDLSVELRFVPAPPDTTIVPVLEATSALPATAPEVAAAAEMILEKVIELDDRYILVGSFRQGQGLTGGSLLDLPAQIEVTVDGEKPWPWDIPSDVDLPAQEPGVIPWAYQVPKGFTTPLTLRLGAVDVEYPVIASLQIDVGPDPSVGQRWEVDQALLLAGRQVRLVAVTRSGRGYELEFESEPAVFGVSIDAREHPTVGGWGGGTGGRFSAGFDYAPPIPAGLLQFRITGVMVRVPGPWRLTFAPGFDVPSGVSPTALPDACLTLDRWQEILDRRPTLPQQLSGNLIAEWASVVFVVDLQTGQRRDIGVGNWPDLALDGSRAVYSGTTDGLHVVDLSTGEDQLVPGTTVNDYGARWSPDGGSLAFRRIDDLNLYRIRPDGAALERLTNAPEYELLVDWTRDGSGLYFGAPGPEGVALRLLDLATSAVRELFIIEGKDAWAAFSPDGERVAYIARVPWSTGQGLYLRGRDGSQPRLLVQLEDWGVIMPQWSPDGSLLLFGVVNPDSMPAKTTLALLDPATCQAFPVPGIEAYVRDWVP